MVRGGSRLLVMLEVLRLRMVVRRRRLLPLRSLVASVSRVHGVFSTGDAPGGVLSLHCAVFECPVVNVVCEVVDERSGTRSEWHAQARVCSQPQPFM